jgi:hypothetical protein
MCSHLRDNYDAYKQATSSDAVRKHPECFVEIYTIIDAWFDLNPKYCQKVNKRRSSPLSNPFLKFRQVDDSQSSSPILQEPISCALTVHDPTSGLIKQVMSDGLGS